MDITISLTGEQAQAVTDAGVDAQTVCAQALAQAVERAGLLVVDEQVNAQRQAVVEQVAALWPSAEQGEAKRLDRRT